jgi:FkbM family methyltransferase
MVYTTFNLDIEPQTIVEVGTHCGTEAIALKFKYPNSQVITYEADIQKHKRIKDNFIRHKLENEINFRTVGLSEKEGSTKFYKFIGYENDGADSLYPRYNDDMKSCYEVKINTLKNEMEDLKIDKIDLLCMDTQGSELSILKGLKERLNDINYIILEIPSVKMDTSYFKIPEGKDSVYNGAGSSKEIISLLSKYGFKEVMRKKENDLEDNVLFKKIDNFRFDCVLTAVNNNSYYLHYIPNFIKSWSHLFPDVEIKIIFINDELIEELEPYREYITLFEPLTGINTAYQAQNIRIYYPSIINKKGVLITDIDIYPLNRKYFENPTKKFNLEHTFISYRPCGCVGHDQIAICYNIASSENWSKVNGCKSIEDIKIKLAEHYPTNYGQPMPHPLSWCKEGWFKDQELLFKFVRDSKVLVQYIGDKEFNRIDKIKLDKNKAEAKIKDIKKGLYSDFIPLREEQENYKDINNLIVTALLK